MSSDVMMGTPMDVQDHPANTVPEATQHYAGDVVQFPITMQQSDATRILGMKQKPSAKPSKVLKGPGAN